MNSTSSTRSMEVAGLPSAQQTIAMALEMVESQLRGLIAIRCADEHWDDADLDVDNATELALAHILGMKEKGYERHNDFDTPWFTAASVVNLAAKAFSRKGCHYSRALASAVEMFQVLARAVEFADGSERAPKVAA